MSSTSLSPSFSSYLMSYYPASSQKNEDFMYAGCWNNPIFTGRAILKFDLSSLSGQTITSAKLRIYHYSTDDLNSADGTLSVYRVKRTMTDNATWYTINGSESWNTNGCGDTTNDRESSNIGTASFSNSPSSFQLYEFTLTTSKIQEMIDGTFTNNGFVIFSSNESTSNQNITKMCSSQYSNSSYRPILYIEYGTSSTQLSKVGGIALASIGKYAGIAKASVKKVGGLTIQ